MGVKLVSASGGSVEINPPATASNFVATMPAGTGTVAVNGVSGTLVSGTAVASTSGTSIDFTGIPSWARRVTVMFSGVSTNGTSLLQLQLGSGSVQTTSYDSVAGLYNNANATGISTSTSGFLINNGAAAIASVSGIMVFTNISGNSWVSAFHGKASSTQIATSGGAVTLSGTLDRVRITTVNGTDVFDAGTINIMYE